MRFQKTVPLFLSLLLLCGCGRSRVPAPETVETTLGTLPQNGPVDTAPPAQSTVSPLSVDNQLAFLHANADTWRALDETDAWCYAVTDLDGNGQLEILSSETHGTGHFTTFRAWEVSEDGTALMPVAQPEEYGSTVVMGASRYDETFCTDPVDAYQDPSTGCRYYVQTDSVKDGAAHYYETKSAVFLAEGTMGRDILGFKQTEYPDGGETAVVTYQKDANGPEITQEEYDSPSALSGMTHTAAQIGWWTYVPYNNMTPEKLTQSWEVFRG